MPKSIVHEYPGENFTGIVLEIILTINANSMLFSERVVPVASESSGKARHKY